MKSVSRSFTRLRDRFERAIDRSTPPVSPPLAIYNHNPNINVMYGSGNITNNNQIITNIYGSGAANAEDVVQVKIAEVLNPRYVAEAVYDAQFGTGCMKGTRVQVLSDIETWIKNLNGPQIFWLTGGAGTGKSAIAWTICWRAADDPTIMLGGSFFCSRSTGSATQRDVRCVIPTLAQLLARQSLEYSKALAEELARNPDVLRKQVKAQIEQLLYKPLLALKSSRVPIVFVIDALDECGGLPGAPGAADDAESHRIVSEMLEALVALANFAVKLPVKFLVTSRPETHIRDTPVSDSSFSEILILHTVSKAQVTADIQLYLSTRLSSSPQLRARFTSEDVDMLARLSDGLFIFAATALQYILSSSADAAAVRFETLLRTSGDSLSMGAAAPLDRMYALILADAVGAHESANNELPAILQTLAALLSARMMLSLSALADLLNQPKSHLRARLSGLHAVVHVPDGDNESGLGTLHASFGDYLFGRADNHLRITATLGHNVLARGCLDRMTWEDLCFNVSRSRSSFERNPTSVPDGIPLSLIYACLNWAHHIDSASNRSAFDADIGRIFRPKFLFWLEVTSVLGKIGQAAALLRIASSMINDPVVSQFLRDANRFVASSYWAISRSASHIYISALPFAAQDSLVYRDFKPLCSGLVSVTTFGIDRHGSHLVATLTGHEGDVHSVAYSPDSRTLASGADDGTVRIWDTRIGEEIMAPLRGTDGRVFCVAFAPNGQRIASGGDGNVVHMWSILTGRQALPSMSGHSGCVRSVAFAPDGNLLASASDDHTVRLWSSVTGQGVTVMNAHTDWVLAVAFSPDGLLLASASKDMSVRIWNVRTGRAVGDPLLSINGPIACLVFSADGRHLAAGTDKTNQAQIWKIEALESTPISIAIRSHSGITSLAFSPDGSKLVSAGMQNIQSWDPHTGKEIPSSSFPGHADWINSIKFAPDGRSLASGSVDRTVRIWDVVNDSHGATQPLQAHGSEVSSAAVSPSGTFIVSGASDLSVRIWNATTGQAMLPPLLKHTGFLWNVAISPDDRLIASASADETVRLWDAKSGESVGEPLRGHSGQVNAVAFSRDSRWLASGSDDKTVRLWEVATGLVAPFGPLSCKGLVLAVEFSPDGRLLGAAGIQGYVHLWQTETYQQARRPFRANPGVVYAIAFSPDSLRIVTGAVDGIVRVWNVRKGSQVMKLNGHGATVRSVAYSPGGEYVVSASADKTLRLWSAKTGTGVSTLFGHGLWVLSVVFTPDGWSLVSSSTDATIRIWNVETALTMRSQAERDPRARLGSAALDDEGWLVGSSGELLLWIPVDYRGHMQLPPCSMIIASHRVTLAIDDGIYWGDEWTACWRDGPHQVA